MAKKSCILNNLWITTSARVLPVSRRAFNPVFHRLARLSCALARPAGCPEPCRCGLAAFPARPDACLSPVPVVVMAGRARRWRGLCLWRPPAVVVMLVHGW
jgi:hypothetical protein